MTHPQSLMQAVDEYEAMERDAARYRWLAAKNADENHKLCIYELGGMLVDVLDVYIDEKIAEEQQ